MQVYTFILTEEDHDIYININVTIVSITERLYLHSGLRWEGGGVRGGAHVTDGNTCEPASLLLMYTRVECMIH